MKGWYKAAVDHALPHSQVTLEQVTADRDDLYHQVPPPGEIIPVSVEPFLVEYLVPTEEEIEWEVRQLQKIAPGPPQG